MKKLRIAMMISLSALIVLLDQASKYWISQNKPFIQVIRGFFNIVYVENPGAAFGILHGKQGLLSAISIIAVIVLLALICQERRMGVSVSLALILGGTCGNLIDRVRLGYVVDFLDVSVKNYHWPSFNIADSAITIGVGILLVVTFLEEFSRKKHQHSELPVD